MQNFHIKTLALYCLLTTLIACDDEFASTDVGVKVRMWGVFEAPVNATGTFSPTWQAYEFIGITLIRADDGSAVDLYSGAPISVRIINRPQIIYSETLGNLEGLSENDEFSSAEVRFSEILVGAGKLAEDYVVPLDSTNINYGLPFTVEPGKDLRFNINVLWKNTVTRDADGSPGTETMSAPTLRLEVTTLSD